MNELNSIIYSFKISVVLSHNGKVCKNGKRRVELCLYQNGKRMYINTNIYVFEENFQNGKIINDEFAFEYNRKISFYKKAIIDFDLKCNEENKYITLAMIKSAINQKTFPKISFVEFAKSVIENSDRKQSTKAGYDVFLNNFNKFRKNALLEDIDYNFITELKIAVSVKTHVSGVYNNSRLLCKKQLNETLLRRIHSANLKYQQW